LFKLLNNKYFWLSLLVIILTLMLMNLTNTHRSITVLEKVIRGAYAPLQAKVSAIGDKGDELIAYFTSKSKLQRRVTELEAEYNKLLFENQALIEYKKECIRLRQMLDFQDNYRENFELLPAHLIARRPNNWYQCITIDRGLTDGVKIGMAVISPAGLVGRVASVNENSAQVSLITDREMAIGATIQDTRETNGIIEGLGNSNEMRMINIPYYSKINKNDYIISSGLSDVYPPGINIGIVTSVSREPNGLLLVAMIKPAVDFDKLEEVFIVTGYRPETGVVEEE
jgi:rod shape-determining protein MreC